MKNPLPTNLAIRALDAAGEGITISDARLPDNPLIYCNQGFERLTGYSAEEVIGLNCRFLQGPASDSAVVEEIRSAIRDRRSCRVELLNHRKDGGVFWNRLSITPVCNEAGEVTHFIGVQSDVTQRRQAEDDLARALGTMKADVKSAARIQKALLPPGPPELPWVSAAWAFEPCEDLAGDLLNIVPLDQQTLAAYVLDVSGHGVAASLLSVMVTQVLSSMLSQPEGVVTPVDVACRLNERFPFDQRTRQFFTIAFGILDVKSRSFRYVSAGQGHLVHVPQDGPVEPLDGRGYPIGIAERPGYDERIVHLGLGDRLYLWTDGIIEARDPNGSLFGFDRLMATAEAGRSLTLEESVQAILREVRTHRAQRTAEDDASILALEMK